MKKFLLATIGLALAACEQQQDLGEGSGVSPQRLPAEACAKAADGLAKLGKSGGFDYTDAGEATIAEDAWLRLGGTGRDQLGQVLAVNAACKAKEPPMEQQIVVRSEFGRVLTQRVVETGVDLSRMLEE